MYTDRSGLEHANAVESVQQPLLAILSKYVRRRRQGFQPHCLAKLLSLLTSVRSISLKGQCHVIRSQGCFIDCYLEQYLNKETFVIQVVFLTVSKCCTYVCISVN